LKPGVGVEKLLRPKVAKIKLRQDALQTTFLIFKTFCIPQISVVWEGLFQQPQDVTSTGIADAPPKKRAVSNPAQ
jgi:hypothetical protein